jgi:MarR family transcriptional regulator, transcriptional regulator for hemolysin
MGLFATWQVLLLVRSKQWDTQTEMAAAMGVTGPTHHLNALEDQGLVRRWLEASNRRVQQVELTDAGEAMFERLRHVAARHDQRLRSQLSEAQTMELAELLKAGIAAVEQGAQFPDNM